MKNDHLKECNITKVRDKNKIRNKIECRKK